MLVYADLTTSKFSTINGSDLEDRVILAFIARLPNEVLERVIGTFYVVPGCLDCMDLYFIIYCFHKEKYEKLETVAASL